MHSLEHIKLIKRAKFLFKIVNVLQPGQLQLFALEASQMHGDMTKTNPDLKNQ